MGEMNARGEAPRDVDHVIVGARAKGPSAKCDAVRQRRHRIEQRRIVRLRGHHARQSEKRERRIIGVKADPHTAFFCRRGCLFQEGDQVRPQIGSGQPVIIGDRGTDALAAM